MTEATPQTDAAQAPLAASTNSRLRLSHWLWKPWHAKMWWIVAFFYWTAFAVSFGVTPLARFYESTVAGYLNIFFYPPVILMLLGLGFVRAKITRGAWIITPGNPGAHGFNRSVSGSLDPYTDPLDPRSGSLYIGSPEKLAELFGRKWP